MKKDLLVALAVAVVVAGVSFGLAAARPDVPMTPSKPFTETAPGHSRPQSGRKAEGKVVLRVNGDPITDLEFAAFIQGMPENAQQLYSNPAGRRALADELVKLKVLEQEAGRMGIADDPEIAMRMGMIRSQMTAGRALERLVKARVEKRMRAEYEKEKGSAVSLRHVVVAYEGGAIPARGNAKPPTAEEAMKKAAGIAAKLRGGADFGEVALADSDDTQTASQGGALGPARPEMLPPEVATVVGAMKPGSISDPVKTQFGVHVFKVEAPSFEDLSPLLAPRLQQEVMAEVVGELQKSAKVDYDKGFFPPAPESPAPRQAPPRSKS